VLHKIKAGHEEDYVLREGEELVGELQPSKKRGRTQHEKQTGLKDRFAFLKCLLPFERDDSNQGKIKT